MEQTSEMKSLLTASIESVQGKMLPEVRAHVVEARRSPFADEKFNQEVLTAMDSRHDADYVSRDQLRNLYEDPITAQLMIDPVVASNDDTYCRWTIIDNDIMKRNPVNLEEALTIVVDNLAIRRGCLRPFLSNMKSLNNVTRNIVSRHCHIIPLRFLKCSFHVDMEQLVNVQRALEKAKGKYIDSSPLLTDEDQFTLRATTTLATPLRRGLGDHQESPVRAQPNQDFRVEGLQCGRKSWDTFGYKHVQ